MSKSRTKTKAILVPAITTRAQAIAAVASMASIELKRRKLKHRIDKITQRVQAKYGTQLSELDSWFDGHTKDLQEWASHHPEEFPAKAKSTDLTHGTIGFRTSPPKVETLAGWTIKKVIKAIREFGWAKFLRVKIDLNKEEILAREDRLKSLKTPILPQVGLKITRDEIFFVELNLSESETRTESKQEAA